MALREIVTRFNYNGNVEILYHNVYLVTLLSYIFLLQQCSQSVMVTLLPFNL